MRRNAQPARCLADFEGRWRLSRRIEHDTGPPARFTGAAVWAPEPEGGLLYTETGTLEIKGQGRFTAERRYLWRADLTVWFDEGRFFHAVPAQGGASEHWCDPDHYRGRYDFSDWPAFRTIWTVQGPRKAYRMVSDYTAA